MNIYKGAFLGKWSEGTQDNLRNTLCDDVWHHLNLSFCLFFLLPSFAFHCLTFITFFSLWSLSIFSYKLSWAGPPGPGNIIFSYNHEVNSTPSYELIILSCSSLIQESKTVDWNHLLVCGSHISISQASTHGKMHWWQHSFCFHSFIFWPRELQVLVDIRLNKSVNVENSALTCLCEDNNCPAWQWYSRLFQ